MNKTMKEGVVRCTVCKEEHQLPGYDGKKLTKNNWGKPSPKEEEKKVDN